MGENGRLIMACLAGSRLYGTDRPDSDLDVRGVCLDPPEKIVGLHRFEQYKPGAEEARLWSMNTLGVESDDVTIYGLRKFLQLSLKSNPNILELWYAGGDNILYKDGVWDGILPSRKHVLSRKVADTFGGYIRSQQSRMVRHHRWLTDRPEKPNPYHYGMQDRADGGQVWTNPSLRSAYENKLREYQNYSRWRAERNPHRAELEERYGFDTKHAAHIYRLHGEAMILLSGEDLQFPLPGWLRDVYVDALNGRVEYDEVLAFAEDAMESLRSAATRSPLQARPGFDKIDALAQRVLLGHVKNWRKDSEPVQEE